MSFTKPKRIDRRDNNSKRHEPRQTRATRYRLTAAQQTEAAEHLKGEAAGANWKMETTAISLQPGAAGEHGGRART